MVKYQTLNSKNDNLSFEVFFLIFANFFCLTSVNVFIEVSRNDPAGVWRARARPALNLRENGDVAVIAKPCACSIKS